MRTPSVSSRSARRAFASERRCVIFVACWRASRRIAGMGLRCLKMASNKQHRVLVVAPTGRDGRLLCDMLGGNGIVCERFADVQQLCGQLHQHGAGALLLTEEALGP